MKPRPSLSELTSAELLTRAAEYRAMAETCGLLETRAALIRLAERCEGMAGKG